MRFMLLLYRDPASRTDSAASAFAARCEEFERQARERNALVGSLRLNRPEETTAVRRPSDVTLLSDGPFSKTDVFLAGFFVLDCRDMNEAVEWARKLPLQGLGVEVRPVLDLAQAAHGRYVQLT